MDPAPVIDGIDLSNPAKFLKATISSEQGRRRLKILQVWKENLEQHGHCLTPRSQNEFDQLTSAFDRVLTAEKKISRKEPSDYYYLRFQEDEVIGVGSLNSESIETKFSIYFNEIKTSEHELVIFVGSFPKGGDTHCHLTGAMDSIEYLKWAVENDLELSLEGKRIKASKIQEDPQLECVFFEHTTLPYKTENPNRVFFDKFDNSEIIDPYLVLSTHLCPLLEEAHEHNALYIETSKGFETHLKKWNEKGKKEYLQDFPECDVFKNKPRYEELLKRKLEILLNHPIFKQKKELYIKYIDEADKSEVISNKLKKNGFKDSLFSLGNPVVVRLNGDVSRELHLPEFFADLALSFLIADEESKRPNPRVLGVVISGRECTTKSFNERKAQSKMLGFLRSQYPKVSCSPHAGELYEENVDIKYMRHAIHYPIKYADPSRLGHATCIISGKTKNLDNVFKRLKSKEKPICIEICLTSNEKILKIKNSQHPLPYLLKQGIPVTLNTDDPGVLRTNITNEFVKAIQRYSENIDYATLKNLARNQIRYSFLPGEEIYADSSPYQYELRSCFKNLYNLTSEAERIIEKSPKAILQYRLEKQFLEFEKIFERKTIAAFDHQPDQVETFLQKDLKLLEVTAKLEKSTLKIEQIDDDNINDLLLDAEAKCNEAKKLISEYLINLNSFEQLKEKIDETLQLYNDIKVQCNPEVQQKISDQIQILNSGLRKNLFAYARYQCISPNLINERLIKRIAEEKLDLEEGRFLKDLNFILNDHLQYIEKYVLDNNSKTKTLKKDVEIKDMTEVRLLTTAVLPELLNQRENAIEGYFRLAHYHSIAKERESDKGTTRSVLMNSSLLKARSLETTQEKKYKENRIHLEYVTFLEKMRNHFSYDTFSCFISYDPLKETEDWVKKFLYRDLITLGIRPIFRGFSQEVGKHEVDYSKTIRDADFVLVLCSPTMKEKYENYLRGIKDDYRLGMEMEFLKDRYLSGKDLYNTFHLQMSGTSEEIAFSNLPGFFQRKNFVNLCQDPSAHYSKNLMYFTESLKFFCDLLKIPENVKANYIGELARKIEEIENHSLTEKPKVDEFLEKQKAIPILPLPDRSKSNTRLIEVPSVGKDYQPRENVSLDSLFKTTNHIVLTQDPTIICGVGKTYLAAQYVYHFGEKYSKVLWLNGRNENSLQESLSKISESLKNEKVKGKEFFVEWVDNTSLVIFDDVADPQMIAPYLPRSFCHTLITSRHSNWSDDWKKVSLKLLTVDEGKQLLARITQKFDDQAAETLAISLGNIPSLISEVGYLLKDIHEGPKSYPPIQESKIAAKGRIFSDRAKLFSRPQHFAGRKPYIAVIQERIFTNSCPIIILQGPPSIGKTSIAHEFAFQNVAKFKRLWHLPCAKEEILEKAVQEFAKQLGISNQEQDLSTVLKEIYKVLSRQEGKTLLIFDDLVEEKAHLLPFFPDNIQMNICTIVTTRTGEWKSRGAVLPILPFSQEEAYLFLKGILKDSDGYSLSTYFELFMGNPFALSFAAHCLKASNMNSVDYVKRLTVELGANSSFEKLFSSLWKLTKENLLAYNDPKLLPAITNQLLPLVKRFACSPKGSIPKKLLQKQLEEALKNEKLDPEKNPIKIVLLDLVTILRRFFILNKKENSISIHPIIAQAIKSEMTPEEISAYSLNV